MNDELPGGNPLTGDPAGGTFLYHGRSYRGSEIERFVGFMCFANRNFVLQVNGDVGFLLVTGGPANPPEEEENDAENDENLEEVGENELPNGYHVPNGYANGYH